MSLDSTSIFYQLHLFILEACFFIYFQNRFFFLLFLNSNDRHIDNTEEHNLRTVVKTTYI